MSPQLVWLITGTSSGFGRDLTLAALKRGEKVIATGRGRSLQKLDDLKRAGADILELDVTAPLDKLGDIAKKAVAIHGRVDVLVNNAGYMEVGMLEENTHEESFDQFNTNVFGAMNVARAFLPYMRERKAGTVVWVGSVGGWQGVANISLYIATKHAIRGISLSLDEEIKPLGLRSVCFEPGYFRTSFLTADNRGAHKPRIAAYKESADAADGRFQAYNGKQPGNPLKGVEVMIDVVKGEGCAAGKDLPPVLPLGSDCHGAVERTCKNTLAMLDTWKDVICSTDFPKGT